MIQDGSIGRGVRLTARLVVSINPWDIASLSHTNSKIDLFFNGMRRKDCGKLMWTF
jgi:hypothetical protein